MIRAVLVKILIAVTVLFNLNIVFADEKPAFFCNWVTQTVLVL